MDRPGVYELATFQVSTPDTFVSDWIDGLDGIISLGIQARMAYGSGGTTVGCYIQTSFDQEETGFDIAAVGFTTAGKIVLLNLSGNTPVTSQYVPTNGAMSLDTVKDGLLGDRFRVKIVVAGTYVNTTVAVRIVTR